MIVHAGFALSRVDDDEAKQVFEYLREMEELTDLDESRAGALPAPPDTSPTVTPPSRQ